ncbi:MAG: type II toxin-antitoxin system antitoxin SocA domain-containing protein [Actinomycetota bacterium]
MGIVDSELGKRLRDIRQERDLSQQQVAALLGVSRSTVSQIETGKRRLTAYDLAKIADVLSVSIDALLDPERSVQVVLEEVSVGLVKDRMRINVPQKNVRKFKEVLVYILEKVGARPNVGETVIYKLLYFIDFDFYERYEEQLVGATYIKNRYGPTPVEFSQIVQQMIRDGEIHRVEHQYYQYPQTKYLPLREPDLQMLKASEVKVIDDVLCRLSDMDASTISSYSHQDVPWLTTPDGEVIEYESVFYRTAQYSQRSYDDSVR